MGKPGKVHLGILDSFCDDSRAPAPPTTPLTWRMVVRSCSRRPEGSPPSRRGGEVPRRPPLDMRITRVTARAWPAVDQHWIVPHQQSIGGCGARSSATLAHTAPAADGPLLESCRLTLYSRFKLSSSTRTHELRTLAAYGDSNPLGHRNFANYGAYEAGAQVDFSTCLRFRATCGWRLMTISSANRSDAASRAAVSNWTISPSSDFGLSLTYFRPDCSSCASSPAPGSGRCQPATGHPTPGACPRSDGCPPARQPVQAPLHDPPGIAITGQCGRGSDPTRWTGVDTDTVHLPLTRLPSASMCREWTVHLRLRTSLRTRPTSQSQKAPEDSFAKLAEQSELSDAIRQLPPPQREVAGATSLACATARSRFPATPTCRPQFDRANRS
ncbi:hypothetical protein SAMN05421507_12623 [Lentzea jiangxiensis]|uniref:Uncharacterized protein n=1 Tax=Lentzea jiangxiensis TaxID=641025 RepID=A0A1H0WZK7_9PSEU|nr:hypothetical protein SAMN05421507_12623 [Lentzea jiangxiensis]